MPIPPAWAFAPGGSGPLTRSALARRCRGERSVRGKRGCSAGPTPRPALQSGRVRRHALAPGARLPAVPLSRLTVKCRQGGLGGHAAASGLPCPSLRSWGGERSDAHGLAGIKAPQSASTSVNTKQGRKAGDKVTPVLETFRHHNSPRGDTKKELRNLLLQQLLSRGILVEALCRVFQYITTARGAVRCKSSGCAIAPFNQRFVCHLSTENILFKNQLNILSVGAAGER